MRFSLLLFLLPLSLCADWPTVMLNPQRHGWTEKTPDFPVKTQWIFVNGVTLTLDNPDLTILPKKFTVRFNRTVQPVVLDGKVVVPALDGIVYCLDLEDGSVLWKYPTGEPILHSASLYNGKAYVAGGDGIVYALQLDDGKLAWKFDDAGVAYMASPCIINSQVMIGGRDGNFYSLDSESGKLNWSYPVGVPILNTAASDGKSVFFGAEDGALYALDCKSGKLNWKFQSIHGSSRHYWPVLTGDSVIMRFMLLDGKAEYEIMAEDMLNNYVFGCIRKDLGLPVEGELSKEDQKKVDRAFRKNQWTAPWEGIEDAYREAVKNNPREENLYVLNKNTGKRKFYAPVGVMSRHQDVPPPPIVSPEGDVYVWSRFSNSSFIRPGFGSKLTHEIVNIDMNTGSLSSPMPPHSRKDELRNCTDDYSFISGAGDYFVGNHAFFAFMPVKETDTRRYTKYINVDMSKMSLDGVLDYKAKWPDRNPMFVHESDFNLGRGQNATVVSGNYVLMNNYRQHHGIFCMKGGK